DGQSGRMTGLSFVLEYEGGSSTVQIQQFPEVEDDEINDASVDASRPWEKPCRRQRSCLAAYPGTAVRRNNRHRAPDAPPVVAGQLGIGRCQALTLTDWPVVAVAGEEGATEAVAVVVVDELELV